MKILTIAAVLVSLVASASARMKESLAQLKSRYGEIKETADVPAGVRYNFVKGGIEIHAVVWQGETIGMMYRKISGNRLDKAEIDILLEANKGSERWLELSKRLTNSDVFYFVDQDGLTIYDKKKFEEARKVKSQRKLEGF